MAELRVGVVGVGSRTVHGEAWARTVVEMPSLRLVGVTDDDEEAAQRTAKAQDRPGVICGPNNEGMGGAQVRAAVLIQHSGDS